MRPAVKLVMVNTVAVFLVLNMAIWAVCVGMALYHGLRAASKDAIAVGARRKAALPNYAGADWALTHFKEFSSLPTKYVSYLGWRRLNFAGETINIEGPYAQRRTVGPKHASNPSVYFFGGSTMWGTGADDANTIPSLFSQLSGYRAENFAETAYTAHQSLVLLIRLLQDGHRPEVVVFYDGANDVIHKCRSELTPWSHAREHQIAAALQASSADRSFGATYLFKPLVALADNTQRLVFRASRDEGAYFNCHSDPDKAKQIADALVEDWALARKLVEAHGGRFIGILQPISYFSTTRLKHVKQRASEKLQFQAVYPRIKAGMSQHPYLNDVTDALDVDDYVYTDFCHISPNGNRLIAERIVRLIKG